MVVTKNLESAFDRNREVDETKLDLLKSLWLDPIFAEKCAEMFAEVKATTEEIINQKENLLTANKKILKLEDERKRRHRIEVLMISDLEKIIA